MNVPVMFHFNGPDGRVKKNTKMTSHPFGVNLNLKSNHHAGVISVKCTNIDILK